MYTESILSCHKWGKMRSREFNHFGGFNSGRPLEKAFNNVGKALDFCRTENKGLAGELGGLALALSLPLRGVW